MHSFMDKDQYNFRVVPGEGTIVNGQGDPIDVSQSDHRFLIENAGHMLEFILAVSGGWPREMILAAGLKPSLLNEAQRLHDAAYRAGIDTIGVPESS